MKPTSTTKTPAIFDDDAPLLTQADFDRARFRVGMKDVSRVEWQVAVRARVAKLRINIMQGVDHNPLRRRRDGRAEGFRQGLADAGK